MVVIIVVLSPETFYVEWNVEVTESEFGNYNYLHFSYLTTLLKHCISRDRPV